MLNKGTTSVVTILIILVVATSWYAASLTRFTPFALSGLINMGQLLQANVIQTTPAGSLQYQASVEQATELNNGDVNFTGLNVIFYPENDTVPVTLTADTGTSISQDNQINLLGHVTLTRPANNTNPPLLVETNAASVFPDSEQIRGTGLITFSQPGTINQTQGVGFIADLQGKWLKLLSQIHGNYAAN